MARQTGRRLATALAATVAVLTLAACGQDGRSPEAKPSTPPATPTPGAVDWKAVDYPLECGRVGVEVLQMWPGDVTGDGHDEAVVHSRCDSGAGSPPSAIFVYTPALPGPRLSATLLGPDEDVLVDEVALGGNEITATGSTYSTPDVPRCCPDERFEARWRWNGSGFDRLS